METWGRGSAKDFSVASIPLLVQCALFGLHDVAVAPGSLTQARRQDGRGESDGEARRPGFGRHLQISSCRGAERVNVGRMTLVV